MIKAPPWKEFVGARMLITSISAAAGANPAEVVVLEVAPTGKYVKFMTMVGGVQLWEHADANTIVEVLPTDSPLKTALECWRLCERLRAVDLVTLLPDNEDDNGPDNCAVELGDVEGSANLSRFFGSSVLEALTKAAKHMDAANKNNPNHTPILPNEKPTR